ncbi:MAG: cyclic nucleotide-binding domain-containing protein, partial [Burkholderiales bacterium]
MNSAASRPPGVTAAQLARLAPLDTLSADRLNELAAAATLERAARGADPLAAHRSGAESVYLLQGEMLLVYAKGGTMVVVGGTEDARHALNRREAPLVRTKAITDVELLVIDSDMLDILATWDGVAAAATGGQESAAAIASAALRGGALAQLPAAHIDELMNRFVRLKVRRGDVVIREGDEGDSYYVVASG